MITNLQFVEALFRDIAPKTAATLHSFVGDPSKDGRWGGKPWWPGKALPTLNPFANNYVCVSSFHPTLDGAFYRRKILFAGLHCVMLDDIGTKLPMEDLKLEPSVLIETSPGNYQAWLFLDKPIRNLGAAETLIDQMILVGISAEMDPGMAGVTRIARVPVGANGKTKYIDPATGAIWRQVVHKAALDLRYSPQDIAEAYGLDLTPRTTSVPRPVPHIGIDPERTDVIGWLHTLDHHIDEIRQGYHEISCPWLCEHSDGAATGTYFCEPEAGNSWAGGFVCHHGHCMDRNINDLIGWIRAQRIDHAKPIPLYLADIGAIDGVNDNEQ